MSALGNFTNALLDSVSTVNNVIDQKMETQAKIDASHAQTALERDAFDFANQLQKSNKYDTWETDMDAFFDEKKSAMEDPDNNDYYCRNNYTAQLVGDMIDQARNSYHQKLVTMADAKIRDQNIASYNDSCRIIDQMYSGQENIDRKNAELRGLWEHGDIDTTTYQEQLGQNYYTGTLTNYTKNFSDDIITAAIGAGKDFDTTFKEYKKSLGETKYYGIDGLEVPYDKSKLEAEAEKQCEVLYNSKLQSLQNNNLSWFVSDYSDINSDIVNLMTGSGNKNIADITSRINIGINKCDKMTGLMLATGKQKEVSNWYKSLLDDLKSWQKSGGTTGSGTLQAYESYIKNMPDEALARVQDGTLADTYTAVEACNNIQTEAWMNGNWKEVEKLNTQQEKNEYYATHFEKYPTLQLLDSKTLKTRLANEPMFASVKSKLDTFEKDYKKDPSQYDPDSLRYINEAVIDIVASSGKDTDMQEQVKTIDSKINACTVGKLNKMLKPQSAGILGIGAESDESYVARTTKELSDNDVVFTDTKGNEQWAPGTKEKVDAVAKRQMEIMSGQLDKDLTFYEYKKVRNDIEPIPLFKDSEGNVYHYEADEKGKTASIVDQNGKVITPVSKKDKKAEDKAAKAESKQNIKEANAAYNATVEARSESELQTASTLQTMPKGITDLKPEVWQNMSASERKAEIDAVIIRLESGNKQMLEKYGVTKDQIKNMTREQRYNLVIGK